MELYYHHSLKLTEDGESLEDYNLGVRHNHVCINSNVISLVGLIQPNVKRRKYGVDPVAHKQRMDHIKEVIELYYSGVRCIRGF